MPVLGGRWRDRRRRRREGSSKKPAGGFVKSAVALLVFVLLGACGGVFRWAGCSTGLMGTVNKSESDLGSISQGIAMSGSEFEFDQKTSSHTQVTIVSRSDEDSILLATSEGKGFKINWASKRNPDGATLDAVLDAVMAYATAMSKSPEGGSELPKLLYQLDRTNQLIKESGVASFGSYGSSSSSESTGPGFIPPPSSGGPGSSE